MALSSYPTGFPIDLEPKKVDTLSVGCSADHTATKKDRVRVVDLTYLLQIKFKMKFAVFATLIATVSAFGIPKDAVKVCY
jgi:hypothetical protein